MIARRRAAHLEDDEAFDRLFPEWARRLSRGNWTNLEVARRAAALLVARDGARVLDVGSGVGKLCLIGALTTRGRFHGVEKRQAFVSAAREAAARLRVEQVKFTCADMADVDWRPYDAIYLFNPFAEFYDRLLEPFDDVTGTDHAQHARYVAHVQERLLLAEPGTRVVTYNGFGGELPVGYRLEHTEPAESDRLELWIKAV